MVDVSFIIPAFNEEDNILNVIRSIKSSFFYTYFNYEIIVVDNESTDSTRSIVENNFSEVLLLTAPKGCTIAQVRNLGANSARGEILVFIDADVELDRIWGNEFLKAYNSIKTTKLITGSVCGIPDDASWVSKSWYTPILNKPRNYINSGHLIISKKNFESIGGFNQELKTGEDSDFSRTATEFGFTIKNDPILKAIHLGYPKTIVEFFNRERWHSTGNFNPVSNIFNSKTSITILMLTIWAVLSIIFSIAFFTIIPMFIFIVGFILLSVAFAFLRGGLERLIQKTILASTWFLARMSKLIWP